MNFAKDVWEKCYDKAYAIARAGNADKHARQAAFDAIVEEYLANMGEEEAAEKGALVKRYYHDVEKEAVRRCILDEGIRLDRSYHDTNPSYLVRNRLCSGTSRISSFYSW